MPPAAADRLRPAAGRGGVFDAVIAGGGLAGLSLAAHLAAQGWRDRSVLVIDDASVDPDAVWWGSWSAGVGLLDRAAAHTYRQIHFFAGGASRTLGLGAYRYQLVRRTDLYTQVSGLLAGCPGFAVTTGRVEKVHEDCAAAEVTVDGQVVRARWVFDSVSEPARTPVDARLAFTGWEMSTTRPAFDPATLTLFDFRTPQGDGVRFAYVLPTSTRSALVELTEFVPRHGRPFSGEAQREALAEYVDEVLGIHDFAVQRTESAVLPLRVSPPGRGTGRVLTIGARAGLMKASTGYAYQRVQRDSEAIAASLVRYGHPFGRPRPSRWYRLLDAVLLEVLDREPSQWERAFARLLLRNPAERVLRFLDEDTSRRDEVRLIASMPPAPFVRGLGRLALRGAGDGCQYAAARMRYGSAGSPA